MKRRNFLRGVMSAGAAMVAGNRSGALSLKPLTSTRSSPAVDSRIEVLVNEPIGKIAPEIYGHFAEHLGGVIYDGIWVGEDSKIPNIGGIRKSLVEALRAWLEVKLATVSAKSNIAEAIRYGFSHWDGLVRFLEDGRIEMDTNSVERAMRSVALQRKNSLFAGHDAAAENWACVSSLVETAKLNSVNPQAYLSDLLTNSSTAGPWPSSTS